MASAALSQAIAKTCPKAVVNIISNPVNSTVPIAAEVFKKAGTYDPAKLFGVTTLDVVRANTFVSAAKGTDLAATAVPVIGGHAGITILPLLSQAEPAGLTFTPDELEKLTVRIQNAGTEVVEAKAGAGSATLSMAYAAARFAESCLRGMAGEANVYECAFVASTVEPSVAFFSSKVLMGPAGAKEVFPVGKLTDYEKGWYDKMLEELKGSIAKGVEFANK
jgi:malate dehydrogenase